VVISFDQNPWCRDKCEVQYFKSDTLEVHDFKS
jgi:hypothetical protein